jgi:uncharacterized integral membrane protein
MEKKKDRTWFYVVNGLILLVLMIFILQNRQMITIKFLGINIDGPAFFVYVILFGIGFFSGWLWYYFHRSKKDKQLAKELREKEQSKKQVDE